MAAERRIFAIALDISPGDLNPMAMHADLSFSFG